MEIDTGKIWLALQTDNELTAIVCSRQLQIYRNGKKVLILAGKAAPKVLMEDPLATLIGSHNSQQSSHRYEKSDSEEALRNANLSE